MIIRLSVSDNDFQELLEKYASNLFFNLGEDGEKLTTDNAIEKWHMQDKINQILNPNIGKKMTKEDEEFLEERIRKSFAYFCEKRKPSSKDYLVSKLTVKFLKSMTDKWENGEACYWFQHSGTVVTQ